MKRLTRMFLRWNFSTIQDKFTALNSAIKLMSWTLRLWNSEIKEPILDAEFAVDPFTLKIQKPKSRPKSYLFLFYAHKVIKAEFSHYPVIIGCYWKSDIIGRPICFFVFYTIYVCTYVSKRVGLCMYVCKCVYMYVSTCMHAFMYLCVHVCMNIYNYVCMHSCMHLCLCNHIYKHVCVYVCMHATYACMHVCRPMRVGLF